MTLSANQVSLSYPKPRNSQTKIISIRRTDSSTVKCWLPKGAFIVAVRILQTTDAVTATGSFVLGWTGATTAIVTAFTMATTKVGLVGPGAGVGTVVGQATQLTQDQAVLSTYTVGSSSAGGEGYVMLEYFVPGPGEGFDE